MSRALSGLGVSPGIAIGEPVVHETRPISTLRITIPSDKVDAEIERFRKPWQRPSNTSRRTAIGPRNRWGRSTLRFSRPIS